MSIDVNGFDNTPEWGYCKAEDCREEAFPIWKSGDYPDDPDLLLCPKHIGLLIADLSRQISTGYQAALLAELTAARAVVQQVRQWSLTVELIEAMNAYDATVKASKQ